MTDLARTNAIIDCIYFKRACGLLRFGAYEDHFRVTESSKSSRIEEFSLINSSVESAYERVFEQLFDCSQNCFVAG
jgi:hypothetical protein